MLFTSQAINWWTGIVWIIVMFLSAVWTIILTAPIHCKWSIDEQVMQCYISPNLFQWANKLIYIFNSMRVQFSANVHFWVKYYFKFSWFFFHLGIYNTISLSNCWIHSMFFSGFGISSMRWSFTHQDRLWKLHLWLKTCGKKGSDE